LRKRVKINLKEAWYHPTTRESASIINSFRLPPKFYKERGTGLTSDYDSRWPE
jgi:hypothetical protein